MIKRLFRYVFPSSEIHDGTITPHMLTEDELRLLDICSGTSERSLEIMRGSLQGLTDDEADMREREYGPNETARAGKPHFIRDLTQRFKSPLVIQLLIIAVVSGIIGEMESMIIVIAMVFLSVGLSYLLDRRSSLAVEALGKRVQSCSITIRDGNEIELPIVYLVPGDIVLLHAGSIIPADIRLLTARDFFVEQSALTGESMPVEKNAEPAGIEGRPIYELDNACFLGTYVDSGSATGLVVNTGNHTFFGAIAKRLAQRGEETSFDKGIRSFTWLMIRLMVVMTFSVFMIVGLTKGNWLAALFFGLSVAVGLTPEMLPMIVTVNLAKGALSMSKKKVIIKRLPSIQNFGAIDILCTDKTGTLTQDRVILERHLDVLGEDSENVLRYAYLNSYFQTGLRNLLDRAVLVHREFEIGNRCRLVDELPFDFQRRRMSVAVECDDIHVLICKGAVEELYASCDRYQLDDEIYPLIDMIRDELFKEVADLNYDGYRCLAIAYREFPASKTRFTHADESGLILLGYLAFLDPPKDSAPQALVRLREAGVRVKVLTGDNALVTGKICRQVGLEADHILTGGELMGMSPEVFALAVAQADILAKLTPAQKEEVIISLRREGHIVGYLGDGINDAQALRAADVGISVDTAADVAKESADIVLLEKSLLVLEEGIIEGRKVFANIIKYIRMGASSSFGNMFSVVGASYLLPFLPMRPIQILLNNLLYDVSQTGIPTDNVDEEQVARPRKWDIKGIKRFMVLVGPISSIFDYATFVVLWYFFSGRDYLNTSLSPTHREFSAQLFQTGWFVESLLTQTLIVHIIRTKKLPFIQSRASLPMMLVTAAIMIIGVWLPYSPFASAFGFVPLPMDYWIWVTAFLLMYSMLSHKVTVLVLKRFGGE